MSATDELRRMLDERGVEWTAPNSCLRDEMTSWAAGGFYYDAFEVPEPDGTFLLTATHQDDLTPEQAIAATLGDAFTREECEASFVHGYSLGTLPVGSDPQWDENRQTVDEHMAELGWVRAATLGGTCETCPQMGNPDSFIRHLMGCERRNAERTCQNISDPPEGFLCSSCGWGDFAEPSHLLTTAKFAGNDKGPNHCPNCGARVVSE